MIYVAFIFAVFGLVAYLEVSSLKRRMEKLEEQLAKTEGTPWHAERQSLQQAARSCIGKTVKLELREDHEDVDIGMYGNRKHGSNTILDADEEWLLVYIDSPKIKKHKLIRMQSIQRISEKKQ